MGVAGGCGHTRRSGVHGNGLSEVPEEDTPILCPAEDKRRSDWSKTAADRGRLAYQVTGGRKRECREEKLSYFIAGFFVGEFLIMGALKIIAQLTTEVVKAPLCSIHKWLLPLLEQAPPPHPAPLPESGLSL